MFTQLLKITPGLEARLMDGDPDHDVIGIADLVCLSNVTHSSFAEHRLISDSEGIVERTSRRYQVFKRHHHRLDHPSGPTTESPSHAQHEIR